MMKELSCVTSPQQELKGYPLAREFYLVLKELIFVARIVYESANIAYIIVAC
jgi:hypothetical protein